MNDNDILEKFYQRALHFLSFRPRSEKEVFTYLKKKLKDTRRIEKVIVRLKKENLINDEEFVDWWLEQRLSFNPKSKKALRLELLQKGIDRDLIEEKLSRMDQDRIQSAVRILLVKKAKLYSNFRQRLQRQKLINYFIGRGFEFDLVKKLVDEFLEKR